MTLPAYQPPWWMRGGNTQTLWPAFFAQGRAVTYERSLWQWGGGNDDSDGGDGDVIAADYLGPSNAPQSSPSKVLVLFHGLEGSSQSHYAKAIARYFSQLGWGVIVPHFRGCGGVDNRLLRAYHSGDADEIDRMLRRARQLHPQAALYAAGVSLGGNALLCWLAQDRNQTAQLTAAASVCAPLDLAACERQLQTGFSSVYGDMFARELTQKTLRKLPQFAVEVKAFNLDLEAIKRAKTVFEFDDAFTAPVHGYEGAADYYARASAKPKLAQIQLPTLLLNSVNDPFIPKPVFDDLALSPSITPHLCAHGGHVGFAGGRLGTDLSYLPRTLAAYFLSSLSS